MTTTVDTSRVVRCRYIASHPRRGVNQCTGEAADPTAELLLCTTHLAAAWRMIDDLRSNLPAARGAR